MRRIVKFEAVPLAEVDWAGMDAFEDRTFSQRRGWLEFIREAQNGRIVIARLEDSGRTVGYFSGLVVRRFGVRIMGSPFPGWTTPYLGFNLEPGVPRTDAIAALLPFVFRELGCLHLELADPLLARSDVARFGFETQVGTTFISDLRADEEALFSQMDSSTRRAIRKADKGGVTIEEATPDGFADEYFGHLVDVFAKQQLRPTYDRDRVGALVSHVHPSGDLLLLRARDPDGRSIATGIFPGFNRLSYFWGNGSLREFQILRPNEAIHWYAMRYWRARGMASHNWGGGGDYKEKYGGERVETLTFRLSRFAAIGAARELARTIYYLPRTIQRRRHLRRVG
jgi:hypothetical protein